MQLTIVTPGRPSPSASQKDAEERELEKTVRAVVLVGRERLIFLAFRSSSYWGGRVAPASGDALLPASLEKCGEALPTLCSGKMKHTPLHFYFPAGER